MAYVLQGGPRDRQLVDDLPRGYLPVPEPGFGPMSADIDLPVDSAVWAADLSDADAPDGGDAAHGPHRRLHAL